MTDPYTGCPERALEPPARDAYLDVWCGCTHRNGLWWLSINVRQPYGIGAESSGNACRSHTLSKRAGGI